jgi:hypothetical protein
VKEERKGNNPLA